jgi:hypothetical protein
VDAAESREPSSLDHVPIYEAIEIEDATAAVAAMASHREGGARPAGSGRRPWPHTEPPAEGNGELTRSFPRSVDTYVVSYAACLIVLR